MIDNNKFTVYPFFFIYKSKVQYFSYSASKKLKILKYAKLYDLRAAVHYFTIDHSIISCWKKKEKLKTAKGKNQRIGAERKAHYSEAETCLKTWLLEF